MFIHILIVSTLVMFVPMILWLRKTNKHDKVLFRFCQVRRDVMTMMREKGFDLGEPDYSSLRELLHTLNLTIDNYDRLKTASFNLWRFIGYLKEFKRSADMVERLEISGNPTNYIEFKARLLHTTLIAFFTYTPFIKRQICFRASIWLLRHLGKLRILQMKQALNYLLFINELAERTKACLRQWLPAYQAKKINLSKVKIVG